MGLVSLVSNQPIFVGSFGSAGFSRSFVGVLWGPWLFCGISTLSGSGARQECWRVKADGAGGMTGSKPWGENTRQKMIRGFLIKWWLRIKQEGQTAGFGPFWYRFFEPQPNTIVLCGGFTENQWCFELHLG